MAKTHEEILHELEAVKRHIRWPIRSIATLPMFGAVVNVSFDGEFPLHRDLLISETNEQAVLRCLAIVFPELMGENDGKYTIRKNGVYLRSATDFDEARNYIASAISGYEEIYAIEDISGKITRFVANEDGSLNRLD